MKSVQIITDLFGEAIKIAKEIHLKRVTEERDAAEAAKKIAQENADEQEKEEKAKAPRKRAAKSDDAAAKPARKRTVKKAADAEVADK